MYPVLRIWRYNQDKKVATFALRSDPGPTRIHFGCNVQGGGVWGGVYNRKTKVQNGVVQCSNIDRQFARWNLQ